MSALVPEAVPTGRAAAAARRLPLLRRIARIRAAMPEGRMLPDHLWHRRTA
jgi:hypothetical protein